MDRNEALRVLVVSSIDGDALKALSAEHDVIQKFDPDPEVLRELVQDRHVIIFRSGVQFPAEILDNANDLKLMLRAGAGLDNVDAAYLARKGIDLKHVPEPGSRAVAELTVGLIIALSRKLALADRLLRDGQWAKHSLLGVLLQGKTLGLVGAGRIGLEVGKMAQALDMECIGCVEPSLMDDPTVMRSLDAHGIQAAEFDKVVEEADFLSIHVPLTEETHHLIDGKVMARMKPGSFLINTSRGGVVNEDDLCEALEEPAHLGGVAVDVYEGEQENRELDESLAKLRKFPNVILTPHIGSMAAEVQAQIGQRVLELVDEVRTG